MAQIILTLLDCSFVVGVFMGRREQKLGCLVLMYFPLVFEVISRACFPLTPAAPFIVSSMLLLVSF